MVQGERCRFVSDAEPQFTYPEMGEDSLNIHPERVLGDRMESDDIDKLYEEFGGES